MLLVHWIEPDLLACSTTLGVSFEMCNWDDVAQLELSLALDLWSYILLLHQSRFIAENESSIFKISFIETFQKPSTHVIKIQPRSPQNTYLHMCAGESLNKYLFSRASAAHIYFHICFAPLMMNLKVSETEIFQRSPRLTLIGVQVTFRVSFFILKWLAFHCVCDISLFLLLLRSVWTLCVRFHLMWICWSRKNTAQCQWNEPIYRVNFNFRWKMNNRRTSSLPSTSLLCESEIDSIFASQHHTMLHKLYLRRFTVSWTDIIG